MVKRSKGPALRRCQQSAEATALGGAARVSVGGMESARAAAGIGVKKNMGLLAIRNGGRSE